MVPGGEEVGGGSWLSSCHIFSPKPRSKDIHLSRGPAGQPGSWVYLPPHRPLPHSHTQVEMHPLQMPPCLSTTPMKGKPAFLQELSFPTFAPTAMRRGDVLGGEMFPVEKDHFTEVYLCLLLRCAPSFSSPQSPFLRFRPHGNQCTSFTLCWAPKRGNICTP